MPVIRGTPRRHASDGGVAIVLAALVMVVLMVFAAFAIDIGGVMSARREDQNAADAASLSAAQDLGLTDAAIVATVKARAHETLGVTLSDAQWNSCGTASTTGDPDAVDSIVGGLSCVTANSTGTATRRLIQVRIPTQQYSTTFGQVVGVDSFNHAAFAIAGIVGVGFGNVLPYGVPASSAGDSMGCLKSGPTPHSEFPCDGPDSGAFGFLDFTYFGDGVATDQKCSGDENGRIAHNTAIGIDHDLAVYGGTEVRETDQCGATENRPNAVAGQGGNRVEAFGRGIYSAVDEQGGSDLVPYDGRLLQATPGLPWHTRRTIDGYSLDNAPLWEFIDPLDDEGNGLSVPSSCAKSIFTQVLANDYSSLPDGTAPGQPADVRGYIQARPTKAEQMRLLLDRCITHYTGASWDANGAIVGAPDPSSCPGSGCDDPVFARNSSTADSPDLFDIQYTPRFGYVPQLTTDFGSPASNPNHYRIAGFRAVFIQRVFGSCNASGCGLDFEPGVPVLGADAPTNGSAEGMTAYLFPANMLPGGLSGPDAPFDLGLNRFIRLVR